MSMLKVDLELVKKYNVPGPRYTSYPPATHFTSEIPPDVFIGHIRANSQTDRDLSLYFHLPFCYSLCWFCGCTTVITADQKKSGEYLNYLEREMDLMKPLLNPKRKVRPASLRRRHAHLSAAGRDSPAGRDDSVAVHVRAGHRGGRGGGPAPADARPSGCPARGRLQPRLDGGPGRRSRGAESGAPHPAVRHDPAGRRVDARGWLPLRQY